MRDDDFDRAAELYAEYLALDDSGAAPPFESWLEQTPYELREHLERLHRDRLTIESVIERTTQGRKPDRIASTPVPRFRRDDSDARAPLANDPLVGHLAAYGDEGRKLGKCVLRALLGKGAYGRVYLARHLEFECDVAVKCLDRLRVDEGDIQIDRFRNEARTAVRVTHQNLIRIHDLGEAEGLHYLVMEYVAGEDLGAKLNDHANGRLTANEVWPIARAIAAALGALHRRGIVHRDIKPANILVAKDGEVKLADLGLAKRQDSPNLTISEHPLGTYFYMSPESFADGKRASAASDVWSLGATLVHLLLGHPGLAGQAPDFGKIAAALTSAGHPRVMSLVPDCDPRLAAILDRCLEFDSRVRFKDASELLAALESRSVDAVTVEPTRRRRRLPVAVTAAAFIALAIGIGQFMPPKTNTPRADDPAPDDPPRVAAIDTTPDAFIEAEAFRERREFAAAIERVESLDDANPAKRQTLAGLWFAWALEAEDRRSYALAAERHAKSLHYGHSTAAERLVHCRSLRARELQTAERFDDALLEIRAAAEIAPTPEIDAFTAELTAAIRAELAGRLAIEPPPGAALREREVPLAIRCTGAASIAVDQRTLECDAEGCARTIVRRDADGDASVAVTVVSPVGVVFERIVTYRLDATPPKLTAAFEEMSSAAIALPLVDATGAQLGLLLHEGALADVADVAGLRFHERAVLSGTIDDPTATLLIDGRKHAIAANGSFRVELTANVDLAPTLVASDGVHRETQRLRFGAPRILAQVIARRDSDRIRFFTASDPALELVFVPKHCDVKGDVHHAYFIARLEVSNAEYARHAQPPEFVDSMAIASRYVYSQPNGPERMCESLAEYLERYADYPVIGVTWDEAHAFATKLGGNLPTFEQFRFAAAGGRNQEFAFHSDKPPSDHRVANWSGYYAFEGDWGATAENTWQMLGASDPVNGRYASDGYLRTAPCDYDAYPEGPFGTRQQAGNVDEWLFDGPFDSPDQRYAAGGDYTSVYAALGTSARVVRSPATRSLSRGFRLVVAIDSQ